MWMSDASVTCTSTRPLEQSELPDASCRSVLTTHVLVPGLRGLTTGSGAPKRQPALVHVRGLPVSAGDAAASVSVVPSQLVTFIVVVPWFGTTAGSGTLFPRPPK
jgi:hypothetical protein